MKTKKWEKQIYGSIEELDANFRNYKDLAVKAMIGNDFEKACWKLLIAMDNLVFTNDLLRILLNRSED